MAKQTHIFATRSDLLPGLNVIEAQRPLKYVLHDLYKSPVSKEYSSLVELDELGINKTGDHARGAQYFVFDARNETKMRAVPQRKGGVHYFVDVDPTSIVFWPGGMYEGSCLISGHIGTALDNRCSLELYREFARAITKGFKKVGNYHVGP